VALTLLILLGPWLAFMTTAFAFGVFLGLAGSANPSDQSIDGVVGVLTFLLIIGYVAWFAFVATKVSYRWFDTLVLLIPIYSFIWLIRISWRFSLLPHKNWQTRAEEPPAGQWPPAQQWTPAQRWTQPPQWTPAATPYGAVNQPLSGHYPPATFRGEQLAAPAQPESPTDPFSAPR
jgi:hypothetical protein